MKDRLDLMPDDAQEILANMEDPEEHTAIISPDGVYFDHNWMDGMQFVPHKKLDELEELRQKYLSNE